MTEIPPPSISQIPPPIPVDASAFFQNGADYIQVVDAVQSHIRILSFVDQTFMFRFRSVEADYIQVDGDVKT